MSMLSFREAWCGCCIWQMKRGLAYVYPLLAISSTYLLPRHNHYWSRESFIFQRGPNIRAQRSLRMAQSSESYPMSLLGTESTSVIHEPYHADDRQDASTLICSQKESPTPKSARHFNQSVLSYLHWWITKLFASLLSMYTFVSLTVLLRVYDGRALNQIDLPSSLTLNGLIALLSTINRVALMVPVGSAISQEVWLWFSNPRSKTNHRARFWDLELSSAASRSAWGSLLFLFRARSRYILHRIQSSVQCRD